MSFFLRKKYKIKVINYGYYNINYFYNLLSLSKYSIFFSESESQGLSYFESWAYNVPTLAYNKKKKFTKNLKTLAIPCPYLDLNCNGLEFKNFQSFKKNIDKIQKKEFHTRKWLKKNYEPKSQVLKLINEFKNIKCT